MDRRTFSLAALSSAAVLAGCRSEDRPARDATLLHNRDVRTAVDGLEEAIDHLDGAIGSFNAENWQDALSNTQSTATRLRHELDELKHALGYAE